MDRKNTKWHVLPQNICVRRALLCAFVILSRLAFKTRQAREQQRVHIGLHNALELSVCCGPGDAGGSSGSFSMGADDE